MSCASSL